MAQALGLEFVRAGSLPMVQEARKSFEGHLGAMAGPAPERP